MSGIFISYRNIDRSYAPMLIDRELGRRFGAGNVFQAGRSNLPAVDLEAEIYRWLDRCSILIAVIDRPWVDEDLCLLWRSTDWVRREISIALAGGKTVLPVLLDGVEMPKGADLPPDVRAMTRRIALSMRARTADADLARLIGEVERLAPDLVLAALTDVEPPGTAGPAAALLTADQQVLPFRPRPEADALAAWSRGPAGPAVRLVTGGPSTGKTRLALHLAARFRADGHPAGRLSPVAAAEALRGLGAIGTPFLLIIDDADTRPAAVRTALASIARAGSSAGGAPAPDSPATDSPTADTPTGDTPAPDSPTADTPTGDTPAPDSPATDSPTGGTHAGGARLLLLARSTGEWLHRLREDDDDRVAALACSLEPLTLTQLPVAPADFALACEAFAGRLGLAVPPLPATAPRQSSLLELQAAALAYLTGHPDGNAPAPWEQPVPQGREQPVPQDPEQPVPQDRELAVAAGGPAPDQRTGPPLRRMLDLERRRWRQAAVAAGLPEPTRRELDEIMLAVSVFGAVSELEAEALFSALRALRAQSGQVIDRWCEVVRHLLPGPAALNPLEPEQLAERLIADVIGDGSLLARLVPEVTDGQARTALVTLGRCLDWHSGLQEAVSTVLAAAPDRLLPLAMRSLPASTRPQRLVAAMTGALDAVTPAQLDRLVDQLPQRSEVLARLSVAITERALAAHRSQADHDRADTDLAENNDPATDHNPATDHTPAADHNPATDHNPAAVDDPATARLARLLATRLAYLGERPDDAVAAAGAAVAALTRLGGTSDDDRAELAEAHAAHALALDLNPGPDPGPGPGPGPPGPDPRRAAQALAAGMAAIAGYRRLPASGAARPGLAAALVNQCARLRLAGEADAALALAAEAHELTGPLASAQPSHYRSLHADASHNLAILTHLTGRQARAERLGRDALRLRRALAAARPDAYRPQLAAMLFDLGLILTGGPHDASETTALWTESRTIYEELTMAWPGRFDNELRRVTSRLSTLDR